MATCKLLKLLVRYVDDSKHLFEGNNTTPESKINRICHFYLIKYLLLHAILYHGIVPNKFPKTTSATTNKEILRKFGKRQKT